MNSLDHSCLELDLFDDINFNSPQLHFPDFPILEQDRGSLVYRAAAQLGFDEGKVKRHPSVQV